MNSLDEKKIAFILCINDIDAYAECKYYIERLNLPRGYQKDLITIIDAPSMTSGYQAGMQSSDAKYKVYLHQDVLLINIDFIFDILRVFTSNASIGILGLVGAKKLNKKAMAVSSWDTGKVLQNSEPMLMEFEEVTELYTQVAALDGLLLATQYDIHWRDDLMDGWDFYDISQCMEFKRAGYQAVVPHQESAWCYHDSKGSSMEKYHIYRARFIKEYAEEGSFFDTSVWKGGLEYQKLKQQSKQLMDQLIAGGERKQLYKIFMNPEYQKYLHLKEYQTIAHIDYFEQHTQSERYLWHTDLSAVDLLKKMRFLKYLIKRIEYNAGLTEQIMDQVMQKYSVYAVAEVFLQYVERKKYVYSEINQYFVQKQLKQEQAVWYQFG